jgi:hypothetical protein
MFAQEFRGSRPRADAVDAVFGREAESAVHEEAAGNKEVGRNEILPRNGITTTGASLAAN